MQNNNKTLKVLMSADTIGGVWTYAVELTKALRDHNVQVYLATMGQELSPGQKEQIKDIPNLEISASRYKLEWMYEPWEDVEKAGQWLLQLQEQIKPDIVHLNNYAQGSLPWNCPVVMVAHSCVYTWWEAVKGEKAPDEWKVYYDYVKQGLHAADVVVGVSHSYLKDLQKVYGSFKSSKVIYNGLQPEDYFVNKKHSVVFGMGRVWDQGKNLFLLSEVSKKIEWATYIAGNTQHPTGKAYSLPGNLFLGQLNAEQIKKCLSEASIYVLPAKYEPFGLSALEAALSGSALVLSDIPTLREIWEGAALFFNPHSAESLENAINAFIKDEPLRISYQKKAFVKAQQYSRKRMAEEYYETYCTLINKELTDISLEEKTSL